MYVEKDLNFVCVVIAKFTIPTKFQISPFVVLVHTGEDQVLLVESWEGYYGREAQSTTIVL